MTALQELIEILNESQTFINDNDSKEDKYYRRGLREAIEEANKLLEKEKEQIKNSYLDGDGNEAVLIELNQETIAINAHKDGMDLRVAVYESSDNTCNGNFYELNSDYDQGNYDEDVKVTCLEPDRYYWIMVDGSSFFSGSDEGYFGMKIRL